MSRDWVRRICTAVYAVWLVVAITEPVPLHACPMHDGHMQHGHVHGDQMRPDGMPHANIPQCGTHHQGGSPSHETQHQCTCLGTCCAMVVAFTRTPGVVITPARLVLQPIAPLIAWRAPLRTASPHLLPFATAPPSA